MHALNANDLKIGGVTAIETALQTEPEVAISVRGERRYVVMSMAQYEHLRECELEAAWLASQADRTAGRARTMTAAQHTTDMQKQLRKSAGVPNVLRVQQERTGYKAKERLAKSDLNVVRQAHHERIQQVTVRPEPVEGLNQRYSSKGRDARTGHAIPVAQARKTPRIKAKAKKS